MSAYVTRRILTSIPTLLVIVTVAFFMMRIAPGGPFDRERALPPEIEKNVLAAYDLDQPLLAQYADYLLDVLRGDFGPSFKYRDFTVAELLWTGFPASLKVGGIAIVLAVVVGITLGTLAALRQNTGVDYAVMATAMTGITIPNFVMAPLLTLIFGVWLSWLPVAGWNGGAARNLVLPVIALALPQIAYIARLTRGSMIEVLHANFVRTARAKGLRERIVVVAPCAEGRAVAGGLLPRPGDRPGGDRLGGDRDHLRHSRHRPLFHPGCLEPRLHPGHGHRDRLRGPDHPAQSDRGTCSTACSTPR